MDCCEEVKDLKVLLLALVNALDDDDRSLEKEIYDALKWYHKVNK